MSWLNMYLPTFMLVRLYHQWQMCEINLNWPTFFVSNLDLNKVQSFVKKSFSSIAMI